MTPSPEKPTAPPRASAPGRPAPALGARTGAEMTQMRANAERVLALPDDARADSARAMVAALDAEEERRAGGTLEERVAQAFREVPPTASERALIQALLDRPGATSAALTEACKFGGNGAWHLLFGKMCKARRTLLPDPPPSVARTSRGGRAEPFWSGILADFDEAGATFTMKPDAAAAFGRLGFRAS